MSMEQAEKARSILDYPASMTLWVEGSSEAVTESLHAVQDWRGIPEFRCRLQSPLARAARDEVRAVLHVTGRPDVAETLVLSGTLKLTDTQQCYCCGETRDCLALEPDGITLERDSQQIPISYAAFCDPALQLNTGYFARTRQHLNDCHEEELRESITRRNGTARENILGVQVVTVAHDGVELDWVDLEGAHRETVEFVSVAKSPTELAVLMRNALHVWIC